MRGSNKTLSCMSNNKVKESARWWSSESDRVNMRPWRCHLLNYLIFDACHSRNDAHF
jgi:hypothetical protein